MSWIKNLLCGASSTQSAGATAGKRCIPVDADVSGYKEREGEYVLPTHRPYLPGDEHLLSQDAQALVRQVFPRAPAPLEALRQAKKIPTACCPGTLKELVKVCENLEYFQFNAGYNHWAYSTFCIGRESPKLRDIKVYLRDEIDVQRFMNAFGPVLPNIRSLSIGCRTQRVYANSECTLDPQRLADLVRQMPRLRYFDVASHPFTDADMRVILKNTQLKGLVIKSTLVKGACLSDPALRGLQYLDICDIRSKNALAHVKRLKNLAYLAVGSDSWYLNDGLKEVYATWCRDQGVMLLGPIAPAATQTLIQQLWADAARSDGSIPVDSLDDLCNFRERLAGVLKYVELPRDSFDYSDPMQSAQTLLDYAHAEISAINRVRSDNAVVSFKVHYRKTCHLSLTDREGNTYSIEILRDHLGAALQAKPLSAALQHNSARSLQMVWQR